MSDTPSPVGLDDVIAWANKQLATVKIDMEVPDDNPSQAARTALNNAVATWAHVITALQNEKDRRSPEHHLQISIRVGNSWAYSSRSENYTPYNKDGIPGHLKEMLATAQSQLSMTDLYPTNHPLTTPPAGSAK